jgi:hypothetical protein
LCRPPRGGQAPIGAPETPQNIFVQIAQTLIPSAFQRCAGEKTMPCLRSGPPFAATGQIARPSDFHPQPDFIRRIRSHCNVAENFQPRTIHFGSNLSG